MPILITFFGFLLRLAALNDPVTYDEAYTYVAFVSRSWWGVLSDYSLPNNHIFHTLLVKISVSLLGNQPWSLRLPALLAGTAALPLIYLLGKRIYSSTTGLAAAMLAAVCPALIRYDSAARGYSLVALFTLLAWLAAADWLETSRRRAWLGLAVAVTLGMFTIPTMLLPAGGIFLWALLTLAAHKAWRRIPALVGAGLLSVAFTLTLYSPVLRVSGWRKLFANNFVLPVEPGLYFSRVLWERLTQTWEIWTMQTPPALGWILLAGVILSLALHRQIARQQISLLAALFGWLFFYVIIRRPDAYDRFWAFLLPLSLLWAAAGYVETAQRLGAGQWFPWRVRPQTVPRLQRNFLAALTLSVLVYTSAGSLLTFPQRWNKLGNVEYLAGELARDLRPGDLVLAGYPNDAPLWYYLSRLGVPEAAWRARETFSRAYVLVTTSFEPDPAKVIRANHLDPALFAFPSEFLGESGQVQVYLFSPR